MIYTLCEKKIFVRLQLLSVSNISYIVNEIKTNRTSMTLYFPFFKSLKQEINMAELPSLGKFYPKGTKIEIVENASGQLIHNLLHVYHQPVSNTLAKAKAVLEAITGLIVTKNIAIEDLILSDLFYVYTKCCGKYLDLGYWHPTKKKWIKFKDELLQFSRKMFTLQTFDTESKTYQIGDWKVSEPSVKNLLLAFDYLMWRRNVGKTSTEKELKYLALIVYTCGNNNMNFAALESVLESFLERTPQEQEELLKMHALLEDIGVRIAGIYDGMLISLLSLEPLPKYFTK